MSQPDAPNVLLVVLDSVRARNTSLHGADRPTTPFLASFAERATDYRHAYAPGTESVSSHASMFTGLHVREHGLTNRRSRLAPGHTIWESLSAAGYETGVFSNNPFLTELPVGLRDAFGTVAGRERELPYPRGVNPKNFVIDAGDGVGKYLSFLRAAVRSDRPLGSLVNGLSFKLSGTRERYLPDAFTADSSAAVYADLFLEWAAERDGPWAACVNFMDAHYPYQAGDEPRFGDDGLLALQAEIADSGDQAWEFVGGQRPWAQRLSLEPLYDDAIRRMDAQVRRIVEALADRGELEDTLLVVTADHGEGFGEPSPVREDWRIVGHGNGGVDDALLHVPLVVRWPGSGDGEVDDEPADGDRIDAPASLTGFADAVARTLGVDADLPSGAASWDDPFVPEGPVVAATDGLDPDTEQAALAYCDDLGPLSTPADAVYEADGATRTDRDAGTDGDVETGARVCKYVRWGDVTATLDVTGGREVVESWDDGGRVERTVAGLADAGVRSDGDSDVDDDVQARLEDLGYA